MKRPIILVLTLVIVIALVVSLIFLTDESKQPHVALISERTAEKFSGQNYTLSTLTTETGRTLSLAPYGNILVQGATYSNGSQSSKNVLMGIISCIAFFLAMLKSGGGKRGSTESLKALSSIAGIILAKRGQESSKQGLVFASIR